MPDTEHNGRTPDQFQPRSMREPGAILLISCYELGHQPLGVAWAVGFLRRAGFQPEVLDLSVDDVDVEKIRRANLVGLSVPMQTALRMGVRVIHRIREIHPTCHICCVGLYAFLNAAYLLNQLADSVIGGEYEEALVRLAESLEVNGHAAVEGVSRPEGSQRPLRERLAFPVPDRSRLPRLARYAQLEEHGARRLVGAVEASRGCIHHCRHCPIPPVYGGRFFVVPKDIVLKDIAQLVAAGASHITFADPDFMNGPGHSLAIVRSLHETFPAVTYDVTAKISHILKYRELFPELASTGCLFVISAVESLSDQVLTQLDKGHTRREVSEAHEILRRAGIAMRPTWVAFTPWTTLDDYLEMLEFVEREGLIYHVDAVHYTIRLLIPPGSALLSRPAIQPFLRGVDHANFCYRWKHPDGRMDALHERVRAVVETAARDEEDPAVTFASIKAVALQVQWGREVPVEIPQVEGERPARLTEAWFCCAEPTDGQLQAVECVNAGGVSHG